MYIHYNSSQPLSLLTNRPSFFSFFFLTFPAMTDGRRIHWEIYNNPDLYNWIFLFLSLPLFFLSRLSPVLTNSVYLVGFLSQLKAFRYSLFSYQSADEYVRSIELNVSVKWIIWPVTVYTTTPPPQKNINRVSRIPVLRKKKLYSFLEFCVAAVEYIQTDGCRRSFRCFCFTTCV